MILMSGAALNMRAANSLKGLSLDKSIQNYPEANLHELTGDTLYIIDLRANGNFQLLIHPSRLAQFLIDKKLPESITKISLVVSDVLQGKNMLPYATDLVKAFLGKGREIVVDASVNISYAAVFITPPASEQDKWQVFGIEPADYEVLHEDKPAYASEHNYDLYNNCSKKVELWSGPDIREWLARTTVDKKQTHSDHIEEQIIGNYSANYFRQK